MIKTKNIAYKTKKIFRDVRIMTGNLNGTFQAAGGVVLAAHSVGASELAIAQIGANSDELYDFWVFPDDFDRTQPIRWRPIFSHSSTTADTPTFTFSYMAIAKGEAILDITGHNDTTISGAVSTTEDALEVWDWTDTGSDDYIASTDYGILYSVAVNMGTASSNEIEVFGINLEYTVRSTAADNRRHTTEYEPVAQQGLDD